MANEKNKETLAVIKQMVADGHISQDVAEKYFPEFKESEDENIRKAIVWCIDTVVGELGINEPEGLSVSKLKSWLEKQGEKDKLIKELGEYKVKYTKEVLEKYINNISNKDDERLRNTTIAFLKDFAKQGYENAIECIDWLEKQGSQILANPAKTCKDGQKPADTEKGAKGNDREIPNSIWSEEDEEYCQFLIKNIEKSDPLPTSIYSDCKHWLKDLKYRVKPQPKQEWSEEDESNLYYWLDNNKSIDGDKYRWLLSLKDRIQSQNSYNPYKEVVESIAEMCEKYKSPTSDLSDFLDNVKVKCKDAKEYDSLYPQSTWKPSDEQMHYLSWIANVKLGDSVVEQEVSKHLNELYQDLKKLKG